MSDHRKVVLIPARYGSSRYPGKPLAPLVGASGQEKPLIQRTWEVGVASGLRTVIVTDDNRIADVAAGFGAEVMITTGDLRNGTERCATAAAHMGLRQSDVVINLQGDAPLTPPMWLHRVANAIRRGNGEETGETVATMVSSADILHAGDVLAYADILGRAYHFARLGRGDAFYLGSLKHFGVYAYTVEALNEYRSMDDRAPLERLHDLEQNRWFYLGRTIKAVWADSAEDEIPLAEVNWPEDIITVQAELVRRGIE